MSEHVAIIHWRRESPDFTYDTYNRAHEWRFDAGVTIPGSAAPAYRGEPDRVDPEEAFVASLSACHLLTFLAVAARKRYVVDSYEDHAVGTMTKNEQGKLWVSKVVLRPRISFSGAQQPSTEQLEKLHELAHANCFIAQSVRTEVLIEPR